MITLNTRKLSEMMEASGAAIIHAHEAIRKDVENCKVDADHQMQLKAVREVDDMLLGVFLINNQETMQAAIEFLIDGLLMDIPDPKDSAGVYVYIKRSQAIKDILQTGI